MALRSKVGLEPLKSKLPTELFSLESLPSKMGCAGWFFKCVKFFYCWGVVFFCFGSAEFGTVL